MSNMIYRIRPDLIRDYDPYISFLVEWARTYRIRPDLIRDYDSLFVSYNSSWCKKNRIRPDLIRDYDTAGHARICT